MTDKQTGTVKFFNDDRGYGFITSDADGKDIFVHRSNIVPLGGARGRCVLLKDQRVTYSVGESSKNKGNGKTAIAVSVVPPAE